MTNTNKKFSFLKYFFKTFFKIIILFGFLIFFAILASLFYLNKTLPDVNDSNTNVRTPCVTIQSSDGNVIATYGDLYEEFIRINELPQYVVNAFLSVEDKRFYKHKGIDFKGLMRAFIINLKANRVVQGGSTLTQQLAKNILTSNGMFSVNDRSIKRKLQELILAVKLEAKFTKDQILTLYLNRVYFGAGTYGIDAASRKYFQKSAKELTLFESAILAGLLKAPSRYSPKSHPQKAIQRAKVVLGTMETNGYLPKEWIDSVNEMEQDFLSKSKPTENGSRYFADWVFENIPSVIGDIDRDIIVVTTLNTNMQKIAEDVCKEFFEKFGAEYKYSQSALVAMTPDGAVLSMIGGMNYGKSQYNRATSALRQSGSAFKPFVFLAGLEEGLSIDTMIEDSPYIQGSWKPGNYRWREKGAVSLLDGLTYSVNSVSIRVAKEAGIKNVARVAKKLGITSPISHTLDVALGSSESTLIELMQAYAVFANYGYASWPYGIFEIRDKDGKIIYQHNDDVNIKVVNDEHLENMKEMLRSVISRGTGRAANVDPNLFGKTGSNSNRDAWMFICREPIPNGDFVNVEENSPKYIVDMNGIVLGVWIGNDSAENKMIPSSTGGRIPARIAGQIIKKFLTTSKIEGKVEENKNLQNTVDSVNKLLNVSEEEIKQNKIEYDEHIEAEETNQEKIEVLNEENQVLDNTLENTEDLD